MTCASSPSSNGPRPPRCLLSSTLRHRSIPSCALPWPCSLCPNQSYLGKLILWPPESRRPAQTQLARWTPMYHLPVVRPGTKYHLRDIGVKLLCSPRCSALYGRSSFSPYLRCRTPTVWLTRPPHPGLPSCCTPVELGVILLGFPPLSGSRLVSDVVFPLALTPLPNDPGQVVSASSPRFTFVKYYLGSSGAGEVYQPMRGVITFGPPKKSPPSGVFDELGLIRLVPWCVHSTLPQPLSNPRFRTLLQPPC